MAEHVLRGSVNLADVGEERNILIIEPTGELYRIPMSFESAAEFGAALQKTAEELAEIKASNEAKERIVVPGSGAPIPDLGANGSGPR